MLQFVLGALLSLFQQSAPPEPPKAATSEPPKAAAVEQKPAAEKRTELNLLGSTDSASGESRRNENVQFNLIDNNALKELNIRLGNAELLKSPQIERRSPAEGAEHAVPLVK